MYYVDRNLDVLEQRMVIKDEQKSLFEKICCDNKKRRKH